MSKTIRNPGSGSREGLMHDELGYGNGPRDGKGSKKGKNLRLRRLRIAVAQKIKEQNLNN